MREGLALTLCFGLCLTLRAGFHAWWPFDLVPGAEPLVAPLDAARGAWMGAVMIPVWWVTLRTLRIGAPPAPALPPWLISGPVALMLSLAGFELLRLVPVSRTLCVGYALLTTPVLGLLAHPIPASDPRPRAAAVAKRAVDIVLSVSLLLALAPVVGLLAWWIRREDGGDGFFVQERVGQAGERFQMVKLRTMTRDAEARRTGLEAHNEVVGPAFRMANDPRITRPGRILRDLGLDELPQLINVVRGEMSLVGPRPPLPSEVARYTDEQRARLAVPPGITGLWQLEGRDLVRFDDWVDLDRRYIRDWSLTWDMRILLRTIGWFGRRLQATR